MAKIDCALILVSKWEIYDGFMTLTWSVKTQTSARNDQIILRSRPFNEPFDNNLWFGISKGINGMYNTVCAFWPTLGMGRLHCHNPH